MKMTRHDRIFSEVGAVEVETDGACIYDCVGVATQVRFKKGWAKFAAPAGKMIRTKLPVLNEHYLDWVVVLESVARAKGDYRIVELGAGWGTWSSTALVATRQRDAIHSVEAVAVEADLTHWQWMSEHFHTNRLTDKSIHLIHGAVSAEPGEISFPVIENPDEDYGASISGAAVAPRQVTVRAYTIEQILDRLSGPVDFMHIDIQGAEYDTVPAAMNLLNDRVKAVLVGTHISSEHHDSMVRLFEDAGWRIRMNYERGQLCETPYGPIQLGDGVVVAENPKFI